MAVPLFLGALLMRRLPSEPFDDPHSSFLLYAEG